MSRWSLIVGSCSAILHRPRTFFEFNEPQHTPDEAPVKLSAKVLHTKEDPKEEKPKYTHVNWVVGNWSTCSARCGSGRVSRSVKCHCGSATLREECEDSNCKEEKPPESKVCFHTEDDCDARCSDKCEVSVFRGDNFGNKMATFNIGEFDATSMKAKGAECQAISSIRVSGNCCRVVVYEYPDCNQENKWGFKHVFLEGEYTTSDMARVNVSNNDISCMQVFSSSPLLSAGVAIFISLATFFA